MRLDSHHRSALLGTALAVAWFAVTAPPARAANAIYVADASVHTLIKYRAAANATPLWHVSLPSSPLYAVAVDPRTGLVYVAVQSASVVNVYRPDGAQVAQYTRADGIIGPYDIAVDRDGTLYITNLAPDQSGFASIGVYPTRASLRRLTIPAPASSGWRGVAVDRSLNVYGFNSGNLIAGPVYEFAPGHTTGPAITGFEPNVRGGIAVLPSGDVALSRETLVSVLAPPTYRQVRYYQYGTGNVTGYISTGSDGSLVVPVQNLGVYVYPPARRGAPYEITAGLTYPIGAALGPDPRR